ncbi:MAG: hypothetical protein RL266_542 [Bacteroidota bacterium]|jgi:hypothetical protein
MKTHTSIIVFLLALIQFASSELSFAQESTLLPAGYEERVVSGLELGDVVCENANGKMVKCSGAIDETVLGIVTNVPYITINKPAKASESKFIFNAQVSTANHPINRGDYLVLSKDGKLEKSQETSQPYAIALEDALVDGLIQVKIVSRSK